MSQEIKILAPAKLNLSLRLGPVGTNGLHQLSSHMQTVSLCDEISITVLDFELEEVAGRPSEISLTCSDPNLPSDKDNLLYLALASWLEKVGLRASLKVHLQKNIPSQAGLGGGSSDAAAGLLALQKLFPQVKLSKDQLEELAFNLGSDVPFFLTGAFAKVTGYGNLVKALPDLAKTYFVLVKPPIAISTKEAFRAWDAANPNPSGLGSSPSMWSLPQPYSNDFQSLQAAQFPIIQELIDFLETSPARQVALSGSGPTVFAAYGHVLEQKAWAKQLEKNFPCCQVWLVESLNRAS